MDPTLPPPPIDSTCDLRDFVFMPLEVVRLRDSDIAAVADPEAFRCAVLLWSASWHQVPAASLPNDEFKIARLAGYGRDIKTFRRARAAGGMRGWILCSDDRFYHPTVAEKAKDAYTAKQKQRGRTAAATAARVSKGGAVSSVCEYQHVENKGLDIDVTCDVKATVMDNVPMSATTDVTFTKGREGKGEEGKEESSPTPSKPVGRVAASSGTTKKAGRGSRLPPDWQPTPECVAFAKSGGLDAANVALAFRDFWIAKAGAGACKVDWFATWRNWCRNDRNWRGPGGASAQAALPGANAPPKPVRTGQGRVLTPEQLFAVQS